MRLAAAALMIAGAMAAEDRMVEGSAGSAVRVIIFEDLQCPDCAAFRVMLDSKLLPKYKDSVAFEHRDFPLAKHSWARQAAAAARYFESVKPELDTAWRRATMAELKQITAETLPARMRAFAQANHVDPAEAAASTTNKKWLDLVEADVQEGVARGISKTPTVFVDGEPFIETFTLEEISKAIDAAIKSRK
jgi:protein-disulfide isomerase